MKIILSRKGFDSGIGGVASAILPDGGLLSLPIPRGQYHVTFGDLLFNEHPVGKIVEDLTRSRVSAQDSVHLDPDLRASMLPRERGWKPVFGQAGADQSHLRRQGVGAGDLFLFFGWFRQTEIANGKYRFVKGAPDLHVLFGWLQVEKVIAVADAANEAPGWAKYHPHFNGQYAKNNAVYVARKNLDLEGKQPGIAGGGSFDRYHDRLRFTAPGQTRRFWRLPGWFFPDRGRPPLTYHGNMKKWTRDGEYCLLETVRRGQEFVLNCNFYPEAEEWARGIIEGVVENS